VVMYVYVWGEVRCVEMCVMVCYNIKYK